MLDDENKSILDGLIPYGVLLDVETPFLDLRSIKLDFGIPEAACVTGESLEIGEPHKILLLWCRKGRETKTKKQFFAKKMKRKNIQYTKRQKAL